MKKIVFIVGLMFVTLAVTAQSITSTSIVTLSSAGQPNKELGMLLSSSFSNGWDNAWDAQAANESGIYVYYNDARYTTWASNEYSTNLPIGFYSCNNDDYTLSFSNFSGTEYEIYDCVADYTIVVNGSTPDYNFSIDASKKNMAINDRFIINAPATVASLTTNEDGWASFAYGSSDIVLAYPSGLTIYKGALDITDPENPAINLTAVSAVPAGEGVFVKGAPLTTYYFSATTAAALSDNDIVGCAAATPVSNFGTAAIYTLRNVGGVTALYHYEGTTDIPAGKAVLPISLGGAPAPKRVIMRIDGTQAVENISLEPVNSQKLIKNGQVLIQRGDAVYNLQGQMVK